MSAHRKVANETREEVDELYRRVCSCSRIEDVSGKKCDSKNEIHHTSVMFSRILGHSYKKGLLDEKTLDELLLDIGFTT